MQNSEIGQEKPRENMTWKSKTAKRVKKNPGKIWPENQKVENRSRKAKKKHDLKIKKWKTGQEKHRKNMT